MINIYVRKYFFVLKICHILSPSFYPFFGNFVKDEKLSNLCCQSSGQFSFYWSSVWGETEVGRESAEPGD